MTMFAESAGVLGIDCDGCRSRVAGVHPSYTALLQTATGWTLTYCPECRPERRGFAATPRDLLASWPRADGLRPTV